MSVYEYTTHLSFHHIGKEHVLTYQGLLSLLQEAASLHADSLEFGLNNINKTDLTWLLLSWKVKMYHTPKWNTKVTIRTWAREIARIHSYRDFEVYDENNNLIALASSKWVLIRVSTHSIARITPEIQNAYGVIEKSAFLDFSEPKLTEPDDSTLAYTYHIARRDLDYNNHVNNLCYIDFALESLPADIYQTNFKNIEVVYKKEILPESSIQCFYKNIGDEHIVTIKSDDLITIHAIIKLS